MSVQYTCNHFSNTNKLSFFSVFFRNVIKWSVGEGTMGFNGDSLRSEQPLER